MIWVDREAKKLIERKLPLEWVDDMKTPSGRIHVGSLRGVLVHDLIYKALKEQGVNTHFSYVFNNMDPMDGMPTYLDKKWEQYMGMPLYKIPSPEKGFRNFAHYYASEFAEVFNSINCHPEIIWSSELYKSGKMNDVIKLILNNADKVRDIYKNIAKTERAPTWFPYNPICQKCGKVGTTNVFKWDGIYVYYRCELHMVDWATGCGYKGKVEPINENGKLPWKLDWPAHWKVIGVTVESSGKDHMSSGGSYDMAAHFCKDILEIEPPEAMGGYEWFTIGGKKMSSSKGIGTSAREASQILPPEVFRFLLVRTHIETHLDFNPYGETIPNLFDDYDRCLNAYFLKIENAIPKGKQGEVIEDFARIVELSAVRSLPKKRIMLPRFRTVVNLLKNKTDVIGFFNKQKGSKLTDAERAILEERLAFAKLYLENDSAEKNKGESEKITSFVFSEKQKLFLSLFQKKLESLSSPSRDEIQNTIFSILKTNNLKPKEVFQGFYQAVLEKDFGPKAPDVILDFGTKKIMDLFQKALSKKGVATSGETSSYLFPRLNDTSIFSIDSEVAEKFPSITIGIAVIKGVTITKTNEDLNKRIQDFVSGQNHLTNEIISSYPEIQSYRRIYKEMGIDWHSRRPSPEALLRRIALKKGLYQINTCVDAYNLVVMKNRVSSGAFDLDKIAFPTILRHPKQEEEILLIGDTEPTKYDAKELAYFDQTGGYNIDFNYRDAQRTSVTEKTKNLLINIEGIYDIGRAMVEKTLKETIEVITAYCGGKTTSAGIITASFKI